ncbi:MAG TPA: hypothetical protein VK784_02990 [Pseudonocardiaceae bacterium]|jgi:hypothetical protein|nr:hypothetical protein [Pseudonocardiaceae bacterium]
MIRRRNPWLAVVGIAAGVAAVVGAVVVVGILVVVGIVVVWAAWAAFLALVRVRGTRTSGLPGGLGWLRVSRGGNMRHLPHACTSVNGLVDYLLDRAVDKLPAAASARFAEEWRDHRQHYSGWRLVWWALCVRATAMRTVTALEPARLSRDS